MATGSALGISLRMLLSTCNRCHNCLQNQAGKGRVQVVLFICRITLGIGAFSIIGSASTSASTRTPGNWRLKGTP
jgi:hypothetical protein